MTIETLNRFKIEGVLYSEKSSQGNHKYFIRSKGNPVVIEALSDNTARKIYAKDIFHYFENAATKEGAHDELAILFRLADEYKFNKKEEIALLITKDGLVSGRMPKERIIRCIPNTNQGNFWKAILLTRERDFGQALEALWQVDTSFIEHEQRKLKAILLNRTREHRAADRELTTCIAREQNIAQRNILTAYKLVNYIYMGNKKDGRDLFEQEYNHIWGTENAGYVFRNATSLYEKDLSKKTDLFDQALKNFSDYNDDFGLGSTLCNKASYMLRWDKREIQDVMDLLEQAEAMLEGSRPNNLHPLYNTFGSAYLAKHDYQKALQYFKKANIGAKDSMPIVVCTINESITKIYMGQEEAALKDLLTLKRLVSDHPMDRVRQLYYPYLALSLYSLGKPVPAELVSAIERYPISDLKQPQGLEDFYRKVHESTQEPYNRIMLKRLATPCNLIYWYTNPLRALSSSVLD